MDDESCRAVGSLPRIGTGLRVSETTKSYPFATAPNASIALSRGAAKAQRVEPSRRSLVSLVSLSRVSKSLVSLSLVSHSFSSLSLSLSLS
jgi:hypothetical protein